MTLVAGLIALLVMAVGGLAFACTDLAVVNMSMPAAPPGAAITMSGSGFSPQIAGDPIIYHWAASDGPVIAQAYPDQAGNLTTTFTVPQAEPGYYVIFFGEQTPDGAAKQVRTRFQVLSAAPIGAQVAEPAPPVAAAGGPGSNGLSALTVALGAFSLMVFLAGAAATARQLRRRDVPEPAPVRRRP